MRLSNNIQTKTIHNVSAGRVGQTTRPSDSQQKKTKNELKTRYKMKLLTILLQIIYEEHTISFQTFFVEAFKIVVDSWKCTMLLLYILWDDRPMFMISGSKEQLQQQLE